MMISDPAQIDNGILHAAIISYGGENVFFVYGRRVKNLGLASATYFSDGKGRIIWHWNINIMPHHKNVFFVNGEDGLSREEFLDQMTQFYPKYMEWLLFHPEYLNG